MGKCEFPGCDKEAIKRFCGPSHQSVGSRRKWHLSDKFGMSLEEYESLFNEQDGRCAICRQQSGTRLLSVDHCHETGEIRGLLCDRCNTGLGKFCDDRLLLARAAEYLLIHR